MRAVWVGGRCSGAHSLFAVPQKNFADPQVSLTIAFLVVFRVTQTCGSAGRLSD